MLGIVQRDRRDSPGGIDLEKHPIVVRGSHVVGLLSPPAECESGQLVRLRRQGVDLTGAQHFVGEQQPRRRRDAPLDLRPDNVEAQLGQHRRRPPEGHGERPRLPGQPHDATVVLDDAVEKDGEKAAVHQSRRSFVDQREDDPTFGLVGVEVIEGVFGKGRVVGTDIGGVVEINPARIVVELANPGGVVPRSRGAPARFPIRRTSPAWRPPSGAAVRATAAMSSGASWQRRRPRSGPGASRRISRHRCASMRLAPLQAMRPYFHRVSPGCSVGSVSLITYTAYQSYCLLYGFPYRLRKAGFDGESRHRCGRRRGFGDSTPGWRDSATHARSPISGVIR